MKKSWKRFGGGFVFWGMMLLLVVQGCTKDPKPVNDYKNINDWILENMRAYYLWNTQIPRNTNKKLYPKDYFESLLYKAEDRFSWIQEDYTELMKYLSGVTTEAGYEFYLFLTEETGNSVFGYIAYIKPGTPAEAAGLKRGDFFSSINGTAMTTSNLQTLLGHISEPHTLGKMIFEGNVNTGQTMPVALSVIEYEENPILLDTLYLIQDKKIGYFVYNFFARDSEFLGIEYEKELNDLFGKYEIEGIDELIIDLRYNPGGAVITANALASMISNRGASDIFGYHSYNSMFQQWLENEYGKDFFTDTFLDEIKRYNSKDQVVEKVKINKLTHLNKVHLIVTRHSASASELVINCLKPYMEVVLIGETTYGKNVGSITIYEEDEEKQKSNTWGMQPIISKFENSVHFSDYGQGFEPDVESDELEIGMLPLGDIDELMLSDALNHILGVKSSQRKAVTLKSKIVGSSIDRNPARKTMYWQKKRLPDYSPVMTD